MKHDRGWQTEALKLRRLVGRLAAAGLPVAEHAEAFGIGAHEVKILQQTYQIEAGGVAFGTQPLVPAERR